MQYNCICKNYSNGVPRYSFLKGTNKSFLSQNGRLLGIFARSIGLDYIGAQITRIALEDGYMEA